MSRVSKKSKIVYAGIALAVYGALLNGLLLAERGVEGSSINSVTDAIWYSIVTLSTVGYGDYYPVSPMGRAIGLAFVLSSIGLVGVLVSAITESFLNMKEVRKMGLNGTKFTDHVVVVGWNQFAQSVVDNLVGADKAVAIVVEDKNFIDPIYERYGKELVFVLVTGYTNYEVLKKANIHLAATIFINFEDDTKKLVYSLNLKKHFEEPEHVVVLDSAELIDTFRSVGVTYTLSKNEIASKIVASYIFEPDVARFSVGLLSSAVEDDDDDIQQFLVKAGNPYLGRSYLDTFHELKATQNVILIGMSKLQADGSRQLYRNPEDELTIDKGDYLIVMISGKREKILRSLFDVEEGVHRHGALT